MNFDKVEFLKEVITFLKRFPNKDVAIATLETLIEKDPNMQWWDDRNKKEETNKMKCPICGNKLRYDDFYESVGLVEKHENCFNCGYSYCFAYGQYELSFGKHIFYWTHRIPQNEFARLNKKIHRATFMSHRNYQKGYRRNFHVYD